MTTFINNNESKKRKARKIETTKWSWISSHLWISYTEEKEINAAI
jgi:hypothetical protein